MDTADRNGAVTILLNSPHRLLGHDRTLLRRIQRGLTLAFRQLDLPLHRQPKGSARGEALPKPPHPIPTLRVYSLCPEFLL